MMMTLRLNQHDDDFKIISAKGVIIVIIITVRRKKRELSQLQNSSKGDLEL